MWWLCARLQSVTSRVHVDYLCGLSVHSQLKQQVRGTGVPGLRDDRNMIVLAQHWATAPDNWAVRILVQSHLATQERKVRRYIMFITGIFAVGYEDVISETAGIILDLCHDSASLIQTPLCWSNDVQNTSFSNTSITVRLRNHCGTKPQEENITGLTKLDYFAYRSHIKKNDSRRS